MNPPALAGETDNDARAVVVPTLEHFRFKSLQRRVARCGFSYGKAAEAIVES
jgi:hypothetical protein